MAPSRCRSRRCSCGLQVRALFRDVGKPGGPAFSTDTSLRFFLFAVAAADEGGEICFTCAPLHLAGLRANVIPPCTQLPSSTLVRSVASRHDSTTRSQRVAALLPYPVFAPFLVVVLACPFFFATQHGFRRIALLVSGKTALPSGSRGLSAHAREPKIPQKGRLRYILGSLQISRSPVQRLVDFFFDGLNQPRRWSSLPPSDDHRQADTEDEDGEIVEARREQVEVADAGLDRETDLWRELRDEREDRVEDSGRGRAVLRVPTCENESDWQFTCRQPRT